MHWAGVISDAALYNREKRAPRKRRVNKMIHFCCAVCPGGFKIFLTLAELDAESFPAQPCCKGCSGLCVQLWHRAQPGHASCRGYLRGLGEIFPPGRLYRVLCPTKDTCHLSIKSHCASATNEGVSAYSSSSSQIPHRLVQH